MASDKTPNPHVEKLEVLKAKALEARRAADNPAAAREAQEQIEAIERAIKHEHVEEAKGERFSYKGWT